MASGKVRLFKIASEINIGKETIVEYLQSKGYDIQNKATANLDKEMVELVMEKFKKEKRAAEIQRDKLQKHKDIREEIRKEEKVSIEDDIVDSEAPAVDEVQEESTKPSESESVDIAPKQEEVITSSEPEPISDIVSTKEKEIIELEVEEKATHIEETPTIEEVQKVETETVSEQITPSEIITEPESVVKEDTITVSEEAHTKPQTKKEKSKPSKKEVELESTEPIIEEKAEVKSEPKAEIEEVKSEKKESAKQEVAEQTVSPKVEVPQGKSDKKEKVSSEPSKDEKSSAKDEHKKKDKRRKKKKTDTTEPGESPHLKGLTVLGKIELKSEEPEKPSSKQGKKTDKRSPKDAAKKTTKFKKRRHRKTEEGTETLDVSQLLSEHGKEKFSDSPATQHTDSDGKPSKLRDKEQSKTKEVEREDRKKRKRKKTIRDMISQEEIDRAIKETLSGMDNSAFTSQRAKMRQKKRIEREEKEQQMRDVQDRESKILKLSEFVTTGDLANMMNINPSEIILKCMELGLMVTINQRLDKDTITLIADDYDFEVEFLDDKELQYIEEDEDSEESLVHRPPIVTIMGHVDHGKTSLLDFIRNANVVAGEAGGITQHIGAYSVKLDSGKSITFLDTPGHEAFTAMRARGAQVTDIVILVVAADDSVMPQTIEAISHAKAANVPIVVAINKIDKPEAKPDRIKQQLSDFGVLIEEWGGKYQSVEISAKKGINIDKLLEKVLIEAEILDLKANPDRLSRGIVIESKMKKGWGATATIIVQKGTLRVGDSFVAGMYSGKVRALLNEREKKIEEATPSTPVIVVGYEGLPDVGDTFIATQNEVEARRIANERKQVRREQDLRQVRFTTLDQISAQIQLGGIKELNLVLKGDVAGSVEALSDSLLKLSREEVRVNILHQGVGQITENDVMLASASGAVVIGFSVNPNAKARKIAETEMVDIRIYDIIYDCLNEIQLALEGLLTPEYKEEITATVEVRKTFKVSRIGTIAGCYVTSGKITRSDKVRLMRDGFSEYEGSISSLKRGKDDVREVDTNFECGIQLANFNNIMEGDIIEAFKVVEIKRKFK